LSVSYINNVTIRVDGKLTAHDEIDQWPQTGNTYNHIIEFLYCNNIFFTG